MADTLTERELELPISNPSQSPHSSPVKSPSPWTNNLPSQPKSPGTVSSSSDEEDTTTTTSLFDRLKRKTNKIESDSDSELENSVNKSTTQNNKDDPSQAANDGQKSSSSSDSETGVGDTSKTNVPKRRSRIRKISGSSSESEHENIDKTGTDMKKTVNSDSDSNSVSISLKKKTSNKSDSDSSSSSSNASYFKVTSQKSNSNSGSDHGNSTSQVPTWKKLVDSESDDDLPPIHNDYSEYASTSQAIPKKKSNVKDSNEKKKKQMTQKQRDEQLKETLSKTQRMQREAQLALPYHKPKQLTLKEFLAKRAKDKVQFYTSLKENENTKAELTHSKKLSLPSQSKVDEWVKTAASVTIPEDNHRHNTDLEDKPVPLTSPNQLPIHPNDDKIERWIRSLVHIEPETVSTESPMDLGLCDDIIDIDEPSKILDKVSQHESMDVETENDKNELNAQPTKPEPSILLKIKQEKLTENVEVGSEDEENIEFVDLGLTDDEEAEEKNKPEPSSSRIVTVITVNDGQQPGCSKSMKPINDFNAKEAELDKYLAANQLNTKRKSKISDLLKKMPNYDKFANLKPEIKPGSEAGVIQLSTGGQTKAKKLRSKMEGQIAELKGRFLKHCTVLKPTDQHFTVLVENKGEDSQGNQTSTVDKVDYVQHVHEESNYSKANSSPSPFQQSSGSRFSKYRENLMDKIHASKVKEYQEKAKEFALYNNEKCLEEKPELEEEEEAEFSTESEPELTDEELEVARLKKKKKRPKSAFVDEEAEVSDDTEDGDDEEEDDDEEEIDLTNEHVEDIEQEKKSYRRVQVVEDSSDDEVENVVPILQEPFSDDLRTKTIIDDQFTQSDMESQITPAQRLNDDDTESEPLETQCQNSETLFAQPENSQPRPARSSQPFQRFDSEAALSAFTDDMISLTPSRAVLSTEIAKLVGATVSQPQNEPDSQELMALCSAAFPSQTPGTPEESQATQLEFDDSELRLGYGKDEADDIVSTPKALSAFLPIRNNETPKALEKDKIFQTRLFDKPIKELVESPIITKLTNKDADSEDDEIVGAVVKKKKRRLLFSDEEDSDQEDSKNDNEISGAEEVDFLSDSEVERGYDSEENEILIPKKPVLPTISKRNIRDFVENEAELSGSEDGSADEDERGLDVMDEEDGDLEELDEQEVMDEVGRIHAIKVMDDDDKQVRLLQEILLEDGDLHGEGTTRERQFKWKNIDSDLPEGNANRVDEDEGNVEVEDEAEKLWQEQKAEKAKWLKENPQFMEGEEQEIVEEDSELILKENSQMFKLGKSTVKKLQSFLVSESTSMSMSFNGTSMSHSFSKTSSVSIPDGSDSNSQSQTNHSGSNESRKKFGLQSMFSSPDEPLKKFRHGSFLTRGNPTLSKLAEMTKVSDFRSDAKTNSRNFVFSVITPPSNADADGNKNNSKRKAARPLLNKSQPQKIQRTENGSLSNGSNKMKRSASIFNHL